MTDLKQVWAALRYIARMPCEAEPPCSSRMDYACDSCTAKAALPALDRLAARLAELEANVAAVRGFLELLDRAWRIHPPWALVDLTYGDLERIITPLLAADAGRRLSEERDAWRELAEICLHGAKAGGVDWLGSARIGELKAKLGLTT